MNAIRSALLLSELAPIRAALFSPNECTVNRDALSALSRVEWAQFNSYWHSRFLAASPQDRPERLHSTVYAGVGREASVFMGDRVVDGVRVPAGHAVLPAVYDLEGNLLAMLRDTSRSPQRVRGASGTLLVRASTHSDPEVKIARDAARGFFIGTAAAPARICVHWGVGYVWTRPASSKNLIPTHNDGVRQALATYPTSLGSIPAIEGKSWAR